MDQFSRTLFRLVWRWLKTLRSTGLEDIYFANSGRNHVLCYFYAVICSVVISGQLDKPRAMAVYPEESLLFRSDLGLQSTHWFCLHGWKDRSRQTLSRHPLSGQMDWMKLFNAFIGETLNLIVMKVRGLMDLIVKSCPLLK
jgi:hypothetical protein